jgi:hypothetical protein
VVVGFPGDQVFDNSPVWRCNATGNASRVIAEMATPGLIVSALRFPPALPSRLNTDSGLHPCHQFSGGIRSASAFGGSHFCLNSRT